MSSFVQELHGIINKRSETTEETLKRDRLLYGNSFKLDGERIDPRNVLLHEDGTYEITDPERIKDAMEKSFTRIVVLDDGETFSGSGYTVQASDTEMERINAGEKVSDVIADTDRWEEV